MRLLELSRILHMVVKTITKGPLFADGRRYTKYAVFRVNRLLPGFVSAVLLFCNILSADTGPESTVDRTRSCQDLRSVLATRQESDGPRGSASPLQIDYTLRALADCPADPATARLLEKTIETGDFRHRPAALRALDTHLDADSIPVLIEVFYGPALAPAQRELVYDYLGRLAGPLWKTPLRRIFREGLYSDSAVIRLASVRGLGRIEAVEDWEPYLAPLARGADRALLRGLLVAARNLRATAALELGERHLRDARPDIALAAIELLAVLPGARAREALLLLDYERRPNDEPSARQLHAILLPEGDGAQSAEAHPTGVTLRRSRLFAEPHDRSEVLGALGADTILYLERQQRNAYRRRADGRGGYWFRVATSSGLAGWIHSSDVFAPPCSPGQASFCDQPDDR